MTKSYKRTVSIGLVQSRVLANPQVNLQRALKFAERAAKKGAQIICLPELYRSPYFPQTPKHDVSQYAESIPGPSTRAFACLAKKYGVVIIVPIFEKSAGGKFYNAAAVINEQGRLLPTYRKLHIPHDPGFYEKDYFNEGNLGYKVYSTKFGKIAVLICFDQWFPEAARAVRLLGAEIIFYPTAIAEIIGYKNPDDWPEAWETIQRSHAIANSAVVAVVNRVGREGRSKFWGQSFVADAWGKVLKRASKDKEEVLLQKVDLAYNKYLSEGWGFLRNRRPDTYGALTSSRLIKKSKKLANPAHYQEEKRALGQL